MIRHVLRMMSPFIKLIHSFIHCRPAPFGRAVGITVRESSTVKSGQQSRAVAPLNARHATTLTD